MDASCTICKKNFSRPDALKRHEKKHRQNHNFKCPANIMVSGCTSSGKTTHVKRLLENTKLFDPPPEKILYCYGHWQHLFEDMRESVHNVHFHHGLPTQQDIERFADGNHNAIVLDDLMAEIVKDEEMQHLFTRNSHHKNLTVLYWTQNAFCQGKCARTISLNCAYVILFKNPRDIYQIKLMGRQIGLSHTLEESYQDCMEHPFGYLVIDLSPHNTGLPRLCSRIFPGENQINYVPI